MFESILCQVTEYDPDVLESLIGLAVEIAREGREGRRVGRRFQVLHWPPYYLRALRERKTLRLQIFRTLPCPAW